jgi:hypothetical protein
LVPEFSLYGIFFCPAHTDRFVRYKQGLL